MSRLSVLAVCAVVVGVARACPWPNNVQGQNDFQPVARDYHGNKTALYGNGQGLCLLAETQLAQAAGCTYPWIYAWLQTVQKDKVDYCGAASSGSFRSSLSGSDTSIPSSDSSFTSNSSNSTLTWQQKLFWVALICCIVCCICGVVGGVIAMTKGKKKAKKQEYYPEEEEQQDYEAQQYDQGYQGDAPYEQPAEYQQPAEASYQQEIPMATVGVDVNGDGRADYYEQGVDMNRDGIPDAQQQVQMQPIMQMQAPAPIMYTAGQMQQPLIGY